MYGYIPDARGKTDGYQQVYTLPDFRLLFQVSGYGYAVGYTALLGALTLHSPRAIVVFPNKNPRGATYVKISPAKQYFYESFVRGLCT